MLIHHACSQNDFYLVQLLIQYQSSVVEKDNSGWTPLHIAASVGSLEIIRLITNALTATPDKLKDALNARDSFDCTPLQPACSKNRLDACEELFRAGASLNLKDRNGNTELHRAASAGHLRICKLLVEHGALLDAQNNSKDTAM